MKQLELLVERLNKVAGTPMTYSDNKPNEPFKSNIGHYHLEGAYGGVGLAQVANEGGGIHRIMGFMTKRELFNCMHAYINGISLKKSEG